MRKTRRSVLLLVIFLSLGGVGYKVYDIVRGVQGQIKKNPLKALEYLPDSALQMKDFHRAKIENGRKIWELYGDEAIYFKDQKEAVIKKPKFYYYDREGEAIETNANEARIYLNEKELDRMELRGGIQVSFQGYVLNSEEANYFPSKDRIVLPTRTKVVGEGMELEGSRMEIEMEDKKIRLLQNVRTKIEPEKLAKKKNTKATGDRKVGG